MNVFDLRDRLVSDYQSYTRTVEEIVGVIKRGELRLSEIQRHHVRRSPRLRESSKLCVLSR
jgi:hypothetical protein